MAADGGRGGPLPVHWSHTVPRPSTRLCVGRMGLHQRNQISIKKASKTRRNSAGSVADTSETGRPRLPTTWTVGKEPSPPAES